ncbi:MAG: hypothetical protein GVY25_07315 [Bacteroidetes bacterium]|jgi:hypothetical protein|nr:hypothetical protein [Bacteroidota bacterium]
MMYSTPKPESIPQRSLSVLLALFTVYVVIGCASPDDAEEPRDPASDDDTAPDASAIDPARVTGADFDHLQWLDGAWRGTGGDMDRPFFEAIDRVNDSTMQIRVYSDSALTQLESTGEIVRSGDTLLHRSGNSTWIATELDSARVHFEPKKHATNNFTWERTSRTGWTAVLRYPQSDGATRDVVYTLERISGTPEGPAAQK